MFFKVSVSRPVPSGAMSSPNEYGRPFQEDLKIGMCPYTYLLVFVAYAYCHGFYIEIAGAA